MKQYSTFIFDGYSWNPETGTVELRYALDDEMKFTEKLIFPTGSPFPDMTPALDAALFALHIIGGISYYKTCLPKKMVMRSGTLSEKQAAFWNAVYENGLGEFFYKNDIDWNGLINFPCGATPSHSAGTSQKPAAKNRVLVPVGGGKDSAVTIERLRNAGKEVTLFRMGHHPLITAFAQVTGLRLMTVERHLSPALFKMNEEGALNGHIPITAYLSCVTVVASLLEGFGTVAMSNEQSANYGNVEFKGKMINHQWSKSEEFETMFREYVKTFITHDVEYKSELRSMTELQIVEQFVKYPQYFGCTTSCNTNWKILGKKNSGGAMNPSEASGSWCCKCPKCAFVFALYAAYLPKEKLIEIFGRNLFNDDWLTTLYKELLGLEGFKPFECVGTPEETKEAFRLAQKRGDLNDTAIMKMFTKDVR